MQFPTATAVECMENAKNLTRCILLPGPRCQYALVI